MRTEARFERWVRQATVPTLLFWAACLITGCGWQQPKQASEQQYNPARDRVINLGPKPLVQLIGQTLPAPPLSLPVESASDGTVLTGWKEYEGAVHIVRRWQERSRFRITILPDFNDPTGKSHVQVVDETEEKPSANQPWYPAPDTHRPERSAEVLKAIEQAAARGAPTSGQPSTTPSQVQWSR